MIGWPHPMVLSWSCRVRLQSTVIFHAPSCCCSLLISTSLKCLIRRPNASLVTSLMPPPGVGRVPHLSVIRYRQLPCCRPSLLRLLSASPCRPRSLLVTNRARADAVDVQADSVESLYSAAARSMVVGSRDHLFSQASQLSLWSTADICSGDN